GDEACAKDRADHGTDAYDEGVAQVSQKRYVLYGVSIVMPLGRVGEKRREDLEDLFGCFQGGTDHPCERHDEQGAEEDEGSVQADAAGSGIAHYRPPSLFS